MNRIRVGIIGTGRHGSRYARHIVRDIAGLSLAAISRRSAEGSRQAEEWQCARYEAWQDLVADSAVEAVIAAVPPGLHLEIARACVEEQKPLLLEKPLAVSGAEGEKIVALFASRGVPLTIGQTLRYNGVIRSLQRLLPTIGELQAFSVNQRLEPSSLAWHDDPALAGAGVTFHTAVHVFDALRFITGREVKRVVASAHSRRLANLEDSLAALVEMDGGLTGTLDCSKVGRARSGRLEFIGSAGHLYGEQVHNRLERVEGMEISSIDCSGPVSTIVPLLEEWRRFVGGSGSNPVPGEEGLKAVLCCEACLRSVERGTWVEVEG